MTIYYAYPNGKDFSSALTTLDLFASGKLVMVVPPLQLQTISVECNFDAR